MSFKGLFYDALRDSCVHIELDSVGFGFASTGS